MNYSSAIERMGCDDTGRLCQYKARSSEGEVIRKYWDASGN